MTIGRSAQIASAVVATTLAAGTAAYAASNAFYDSGIDDSFKAPGGAIPEGLVIGGLGGVALKTAHGSLASNLAGAVLLGVGIGSAVAGATNYDW